MPLDATKPERRNDGDLFDTVCQSIYDRLEAGLGRKPNAKERKMVRDALRPEFPATVERIKKQLREVDARRGNRTD